MPRHKSQTESLLYDKSCKYFRAYSWLSWTGLNLMNNRLPTVTLRLYQRHESQAESLVYQHKSFKYFRAYSWLSWTGLNYDEQHASTYVCKIHWDLSLTLTDSGTNQFKSMEQQSGAVLQRPLSTPVSARVSGPSILLLTVQKKQPTSKFWRQLALHTKSTLRTPCTGISKHSRSGLSLPVDRLGYKQTKLLDSTRT